MKTLQLIRKIKDIANSKYKLKRIELKREWENKGYQVYFAHELCQCKKKTLFENLYPELREAIGFKPQIMIGELIETAVKSYLNLEGLDAYKTIDNIVIFGGVDMYDEETKTVYDIKYTTGEPEIKPHHALRVAIYKWLVDTKKGALIYISPKGFKEYNVDLELDTAKILQMIKENKSPMWENWECSYCTYSMFCNSEKKRREVL